MIEFLYAHSTAEDNTYRHSWSPGDVVMWDNGCVLHRADHGDVVGDRVHAPRDGRGVRDGSALLTGSPSRAPGRRRRCRADGGRAGPAAARPAGEPLLTAAAPLEASCATARQAAAPGTILISGGKMTKALQLARSFHRAGHRVVLVESAQVPAHRAPVLPGGRPLLHRAQPAGRRLRRRSAGDRARRGCRRLRSGLQPDGQLLRRRAKDGAVPYCEVVHADATHDPAGRQVRVLRHRVVVGTPCRTRTASPTPTGPRFRLHAPRSDSSSRASPTTRSTGWT